MPLTGDERSHVCFQSLTIYGFFGMLMSSVAYLIYACFLPVENMTRSKRLQIRSEAKKRSKKISESKIE